jgi:UDP-glucose 4-epimerase
MTAQVVVTGGAGFIGSHLCDALIAGGESVICVDNLVGTGGSTRNVEHLLGHPRFALVAEDVVQWAEGARLGGVGCIFHLAAAKNSVCIADPERDLAVNALGTLRLVRAAARDGVRKLVHSSTGSVFGETDERHGEDAPKRPVSYYGISKLAGESYCRVVGDLSGLDYTVLRYYHVIGPRQDSSSTGGVVPIFARQALRGEPLTIDGDGEQTRSFTAVGDAVRANLIARAHGEARGAMLTCASGLRVSIGELASYVIDQTGSHGGVRHGPPRAGDIRRFEVDNDALRRLGLDFRTDWRAMVREVIASLAAPRAA